MINVKNTLLIASAIFISSCSSWLPFRQATNEGPVTALDKFTPEHHELIADNLLSVIAQFEELPPWSTTVQLAHTQTPFGRAIQKSIVQTGYGTQAVEGDLGINLIRYLAENAETETGFRTRYHIAIGELYAERDFHIVNGSVVPTSHMRVSSKSKRELKVNDTVFAAEHFDEEISYVSALNADEPEIRVIAFNRGAFNLDESKAATTNVADTVTTTGVFTNIATRIESEDVPEFTPSSGDLNSSPIESVTGKYNMYVTGGSNFNRIFRQYDDTLSGILVFPDDSLVLGEKNKEYIQSIARTFDPESEIFSVVGCSHGKTNIIEGNEKLANGRANRVKRALMVAGVDEQLIYDEGCWASQQYDAVMPRRGVLLTLKKKKS